MLFRYSGDRHQQNNHLSRLKKNKKEREEAELEAIEKAIDQLGRKGEILIDSNC